MSQTLIQQRKQEVLMRVASSRVETLESAARVQGGAQACLDELGGARLLVRNVAAIGAAGAGLLLAGRVKRHFRRAKAPVVPASSASLTLGGLLRSVLMQVVTLVLLPRVKNHVAEQTRKAASGYWSPSRIFFRMVGLER
jgi:hypothetical protein